MAVDPDTKQIVIPKLHCLAHSQAQRVLFVLEELNAHNGTQYELKNYPRGIQSLKDLEKVHPVGKSPLLTLRTTDGSPVPNPQVYPGVMSESISILQYLSDNYGGDYFVPESEEDKQRDAFFNDFAASGLGTKNSFAIIFGAIPLILPPPFRWFLQLLFWPMVWHWKNDLQPMYQLLEDALSEEKPWFAGKKMGLSDVNMTWGMEASVQRNYIKIDKFPKLKEWHERMRSRPAWQRGLAIGPGFELKRFGM